MVAPGTTLREGIDNVIHASTGALIVIGEPEEISFLFSGGLKLDVDYTPGLIYQVAKMDGAIVLDPEARKISWANVQLMPDPTIHSSETGHPAPHRRARLEADRRPGHRDLRSPRRRLDLPRRRQVHPSGHPDRAQQGQPGPRDHGEVPASPRSGDRPPDDRRDGRRRDAPRRAHRPAAGGAPAPHLQRGRALHHRARRRGPDDRDAARGDVGRRALRPRRPAARLRRHRQRGDARHDARLALAPDPPGAARPRPPRRAAGLTTARRTRTTSTSPRAATAPSAGSRAFRGWSARRSSGTLEASRRSSRPPTSSSLRSTASARTAPPISARGSIACVSPRSSSDTH